MSRPKKKSKREKAAERFAAGKPSKYAEKNPTPKREAVKQENVTLTDKENELKRVGSFYNDSKNNQAYTYRHTTGKKFIWVQGETYLDFINKCFGGFDC